MFKMMNHFSGSFETTCQQDCTSVSLLALVAMVLNGPNIKAQSTSSEVSQTVLTIAQLLMQNILVQHQESQAMSTNKCSLERETPLPITYAW